MRAHPVSRGRVPLATAASSAGALCLFVGAILAVLAGAGCSREPGHPPGLEPGDPSHTSTAPRPRDHARDGGAHGEPNESEVDPAEKKVIQAVITAQIEALRRDDAAAAFSHAAPAIQELFGDPVSFLRMVHATYAPLVRPRDVRFGETSVVAGEVTQKVLIVDRTGRASAALYLMDRQDDGAWKVLGCMLVPVEEVVA